MCQILQDLVSKQRRISEAVEVAGYRIPDSIRRLHIAEAIQRHKRDCPVCRYEQEAALVGMRQGRQL